MTIKDETADALRDARRKTIASAIYDPGAIVGFKGDRSLTDWQADAVLAALSDRATLKGGGESDFPLALLVDTKKALYGCAEDPELSDARKVLDVVEGWIQTRGISALSDRATDREAYYQGYRDGSNDADSVADMECARDGWHDWLANASASARQPIADLTGEDADFEQMKREVRKAAGRFDEAAIQARADAKRTGDLQVALHVDCYDEWAKDARKMLPMIATLTARVQALLDGRELVRDRVAAVSGYGGDGDILDDDELVDVVAGLARDHADMRARLAQAEGALRPFATVADEYDDAEYDTFEVWMDAGPQRNIRASFRLGLYRAARAALAAPKAGGKGGAE